MSPDPDEFARHPGIRRIIMDALREYASTPSTPTADNPDPEWSEEMARRVHPPPPPDTNTQLLAAINRLTDAVLLLTDQLAAPPEPPSPPVQHIETTFRSPLPAPWQVSLPTCTVCGNEIHPADMITLHPETGRPVHPTCAPSPRHHDTLSGEEDDPYDHYSA